MLEKSHAISICKTMDMLIKGVVFKTHGNTIIGLNGAKSLLFRAYRREPTLGLNPELNRRLQRSTEYVLKADGVENLHHTELEFVVNVFENGDVEFRDYPPKNQIKKHFEIK